MHKNETFLRLAGLAGIVALFAGCRPSDNAQDTMDVQSSNSTVTFTTNSPRLSALIVEPVEATSPTRVALAGRLVWDEDITVRVFTPFAGIVRNLPVELNQHVAKGDPLAEIQSGDFVQAQADARKAETDLRRTRQNLDRLKDLFDHGAAPRKDLEAAEADFASAQSERDRAQARLAIYGATADSAAGGFLLPSPLEGVLVEKNVNPGQEVRPDQMLANAPQYTAPLFVVTDPARLWIQIDATDLDLPYLKQGCDFTFTSHAFPGQTFTGRVDTVSAFVDTTTHTIKVRGTVDNSRRLLKAEMFVNVSLPGMETAAVSVPAKSVFLHGERHYVFVEGEPGKFTRQEVKTGVEENGKILVLAGIQSGQRVVTDGCVLLQEKLK